MRTCPLTNRDTVASTECDRRRPRLLRSRRLLALISLALPLLFVPNVTAADEPKVAWTGEKPTEQKSTPSFKPVGDSKATATPVIKPQPKFIGSKPEPQPKQIQPAKPEFRPTATPQAQPVPSRQIDWESQNKQVKPTASPNPDAGIRPVVFQSAPGENSPALPNVGTIPQPAPVTVPEPAPTPRLLPAPEAKDEEAFPTHLPSVRLPAPAEAPPKTPKLPFGIGQPVNKPTGQLPPAATQPILADDGDDDDDTPSVLLPAPRTTLLQGKQPKARQPDQLPQPKRPKGPLEDTEIEDAEILVGAARNAARERNFTLAIRRYLRYMQLEPDDNAVLAELGGVYFQADMLEDAVKVFEDLIRRNPERKRDYLLTLSDIALRDRNFQAAIARLYEVLNLAADDEGLGVRAVRLDAATRLSQIYFIIGQYPKACELYNKYFPGLETNDPDVPSRFPNLLLDFERPNEALEFLEPLLVRNPDSAELLAAKVRGQAMKKDARAVEQALKEFLERAPQDVDTRLALVKQLMGMEQFDTANTVLGELANISPNYTPMVIVQAELYVRSYRLTQARLALDSVKPSGKRQEREWMMTRAGFHQAAGEFTQAKLLYQELAQRDPLDDQVRTELGNLFAQTGETERAKAELGKVPPSAPSWRLARRSLANVFASQRQFDVAIEILDDLLREAPWDEYVLLDYMRVLTRANKQNRAVEIATGYLQVGPPYPTAEAIVRAALGRVYLDTGKPLEADREFAASIAASYRKPTLAVYGLTRISHAFGNPVQFPPPGMSYNLYDELRFRIQLSDLYAEDYDDLHALEFAESALRMDPFNLAAMVRIAEAHQRISRQTGLISDAVHAAKSVMSSSPANHRGLLTLARAYAIGLDFEASAETYRKLSELDLDATTPKRDMARILYAGRFYEASEMAYNSIASPDPSVSFRAALQSMSTRVPNGKLALESLAMGQVPPENLQREIQHLCTQIPDPLVHAGLQSALADYEARVRDIESAQREAEAKRYKGLRDLTEIGRAHV